MFEEPDAPASSRRFLRRFRETYRNFQQQATVEGGPALYTPAQRPIAGEPLPGALAQQLEAYRRRHPGETITFLKYMRTVNGRPELVVEDDEGLPEEERLLVLSHTTTITTADALEVLTDLYVARRE
jgi:hypothetical protein